METSGYFGYGGPLSFLGFKLVFPISTIDVFVRAGSLGSRYCGSSGCFI